MFYKYFICIFVACVGYCEQKNSKIEKTETIMKKISIVLTLLLVGLSTYSQEYFPMPDSGAIWNHNIVNSESTHYISSRFRLGTIGDTIINSKEYSKIYRLHEIDFDLSQATYVGAIREENKKVYAITTWDDEPEVLLYDFGVEVGDIITSNAMNGYMSIPVEVLAIDTVELLDGTLRKRIDIGVDHWIEGIGSLSGLFTPITSLLTNYTSPYLKCFYHNEAPVYIDAYTSSLYCETCFCVIDTPSYEMDNALEVYPNPFLNELYIKTTIQGNFEFKIYNSKGIVVKEDRKVSSNIINLEHLPCGVYLIQIFDKEKQYTTKIIKK